MRDRNRAATARFHFFWATGAMRAFDPPGLHGAGFIQTTHFFFAEGGSRALDLVALVICFTAVHAFWERVRRGLVRKLEDAKARRSKKSR